MELTLNGAKMTTVSCITLLGWLARAISVSIYYERETLFKISGYEFNAAMGKYKWYPNQYTQSLVLTLILELAIPK